MKKLSLLLGILSVLCIFTTSCKKQGITKSGFKYIKYGSGKGHAPKVGEYAYINYYVRKGDSLLYSSASTGRPVPVPVSDGSKLDLFRRSVQEGLTLMSTGDSINIFVPIDSIKDKGPELQNVKELIVDIKLIEIKTEMQYQQDLASMRKEGDEKKQKFMAMIEKYKPKEEEFKQMNQKVMDTTSLVLANYTAGKLKTKSTPSGLKYVIIKEGNGKQVKADDYAVVNYHGCLLNGQQFDNSYNRGQPYVVHVGKGEVIKGWDEALVMLKEGTSAIFFIPASLGYGDRGTPDGIIPPKSELVFYLDLLEIAN